MKWDEVRKLYPGQYVKLEILESEVKGNKKYVTDVAVIKPINDKKEATQELINSKGDTVVYHTNNEEIVLEIKNIKGYRGIVQ